VVHRKKSPKENDKKNKLFFSEIKSILKVILRVVKRKKRKTPILHKQKIKRKKAVKK